MAAGTLGKTSDSKRLHNLKAVGVVIGGVLVHLSIGTLYTFGNMNPYMTSYMRKKGVSSNLTYTQCSWIFSLVCMGQALSMFFGGILERKIGPRITTLIGGWVMSLSVLLTFYTIQYSFALTLLIYGLIRGLAIGVAYVVPLGCIMKWVPNRKGLANGLVVAGFGGGSFIFDQFQTSYINPLNVKATLKVGDENYFQDDDLLNRVPSTFLFLGSCYAVMQLIGSLLLCQPSTMAQETSQNPVESEDSARALSFTENGNKNEQKFSVLENNLDSSMIDCDEHEVTPREMLRCRHFYMLFFMFFLMGLGANFISSLFKAYGQTFITDDHFLSLVGSLAAASNGIGRIFWGLMADRFSFRVMYLTMSTAFTCLMLTLQLTRLGGKILFLLYVCLLFASSAGAYVLFLIATAKLFGRKYVTQNYSLVFSCQIINAPLGVLASDKLLSVIGWTNLFFVTSSCSFCSLLLAYAFNAKRRNGDDI